MLDFEMSWILIGVFGFAILKYLRMRKKRSLFSLLNQGAVVIDVRTPQEYASGARRGSLNAPLDSLPEKVSHLSLDQSIIVCCASGARSAMAMIILKNKGFKKVLNAGSWRSF